MRARLRQASSIQFNPWPRRLHPFWYYCSCLGAVAHSFTTYLQCSISSPHAVAHSLNVGTTTLLPGFCASYTVAHWPPNCGPQPQRTRPHGGPQFFLIDLYPGPDGGPEQTSVARLQQSWWAGCLGTTHHQHPPGTVPHQFQVV